MNISTQIRHARSAAGLTQEELAQKTGIKIKSIQNWEQGLSTPRIKQLNKLATALGVEVSVLLSDKGEALPQRGRGRPRHDNTPN